MRRPGLAAKHSLRLHHPVECRLVDEAARIHGVVGETAPLKLLALNALGAQLEPLPNGKPMGANVVLIAGWSRGKNFLCDAVAALLPALIGAFVAAVLVSELNAFGILIFPKISIILVFLVMAVVLFLPDGLVSLGQRARRMRLVRQLLGRVRDDVAPRRTENQTEEAIQ